MSSRETNATTPAGQGADWRDELLENERNEWHHLPIQAHDVFPPQRQIDGPEIDE